MRILITLVVVITASAQTPQTVPASNTPPQAARSGQGPGRGGDTAALERYAAENAKALLPAPGERRVVFMGDSITDSWGRHHGKFFPGEPYINRGIGGQSTAQMLLRFRQDVIALQPKVVVILGGTNDFKASLGVPPEATRNNIMSMVDLARANNIQVVLSSLTPVCDYFTPQTNRRPIEKLAELNDWMRNYAARNKVVYLDYWHAMLDDKGVLRKEFTLEGLHPNDAGYAVMEPLAEKAIDAALKQVR